MGREREMEMMENGARASSALTSTTAAREAVEVAPSDEETICSSSSGSGGESDEEYFDVKKAASEVEGNEARASVGSSTGNAKGPRRDRAELGDLAGEHAARTSFSSNSSASSIVAAKAESRAGLGLPAGQQLDVRSSDEEESSSPESLPPPPRIVRPRQATGSRIAARVAVPRRSSVSSSNGSIEIDTFGRPQISLSGRKRKPVPVYVAEPATAHNKKLRGSSPSAAASGSRKATSKVLRTPKMAPRSGTSAASKSQRKLEKPTINDHTDPSAAATTAAATSSIDQSSVERIPVPEAEVPLDAGKAAKDKKDAKKKKKKKKRKKKKRELADSESDRLSAKEARRLRKEKKRKRREKRSEILKNSEPELYNAETAPKRPLEIISGSGYLSSSDSLEDINAHMQHNENQHDDSTALSGLTRKRNPKPVKHFVAEPATVDNKKVKSRLEASHQDETVAPARKTLKRARSDSGTAVEQTTTPKRQKRQALTTPKEMITPLRVSGSGRVVKPAVHYIAEPATSHNKKLKHQDPGVIPSTKPGTKSSSKKTSLVSSAPQVMEKPAPTSSKTSLRGRQVKLTAHYVAEPATTHNKKLRNEETVEGSVLPHARASPPTRKRVTSARKPPVRGEKGSSSRKLGVLSTPKSHEKKAKVSSSSAEVSRSKHMSASTANSSTLVTSSSGRIVKPTNAFVAEPATTHNKKLRQNQPREDLENMSRSKAENVQAVPRRLADNSKEVSRTHGTPLTQPPGRRTSASGRIVKPSPVFIAEPATVHNKRLREKPNVSQMQLNNTLLRHDDDLSMEGESAKLSAEELTAVDGLASASASPICDTDVLPSSVGEVVSVRDKVGHDLQPAANTQSLSRTASEEKRKRKEEKRARRKEKRARRARKEEKRRLKELEKAMRAAYSSSSTPPGSEANSSPMRMAVGHREDHGRLSQRTEALGN